MSNQTNDAEKLIVVPLANPYTAQDLLRFAVMVLLPNAGKVVGLVIHAPQSQVKPETIDQLQAIVDELHKQGQPVFLEERYAPSVSQGIHDFVADLSPDWLVLGGSHRGRQIQFELGSIAIEIAANVPCSVILYSAAETPPVFTQIIVPVDGGNHAQEACRLAVEVYDYAVEGQSITALHVVSLQEHNSLPNWEWLGQQRISASLQDISATDLGKFRSRVIAARSNHVTTDILNFVENTAPRLNETLVIIGVSERSNLEKWLDGNKSEILMEKLACPTALVILQDDFLPPLRSVFRWFDRSLTRSQQEEILIQARTGAEPTIDFFAYNLAAALLSCFGMYGNDITAHIGSMLIAFIGQPITAAAAEFIVRDIPLFFHAVVTLLKGSVLAVVAAFLISFTLNEDNAHTALLATYSNVEWWHIGVALAAGGAEAFATVRRSLPLVIAGAAVATALLPPLVAAGLHAGFGEYQEALSATMLYAVNVLSIFGMECLIFLYFGLGPVRD